MSYVVLDLETTIRNSFKRKGNPFDKENWVVYLGQQWMNAASEVTRFAAPAANAGWMVPMLERNPRMMIGFNTKFDILHAIANDAANLEAYMAWVANGGIVWDCQLAEYLLNGMLPEHHMLSLDEVAPRYGGSTKVDEVKALWEAGVDTPDIPEDLITGYLHGDCTNTTLIFKGQLERARKVGQLKSLLLNMGGLLYTIEAERNGMFVDRELGLKLAAELEQERAELDDKLQAYLPADLPFEFQWTNRYHLSPFIFGGQIKYKVREFDLAAGGVTVDPPTEETRDLYLYPNSTVKVVTLLDGSTVPLDDYDYLSHGEALVYKSGKNQGALKTSNLSVPNYDKPKGRISERLYELPGMTEPFKGWASSTPGLYSVSGDVIDALGERDIPFLQDLKRRAGLAKDLGTYFITTDPKSGEQKGMLTLVQPDSIIHHSLNHTSTVTGRLSSSNPNLQNVPKGNKSKVKLVFRSRFGDDGEIIQSDFTSLEIYIQAILTGDVNLINDLRNGLDMHCRRVAETYKISYEEALHLCKATNPDGSAMYPEWDERRTKAKIFSFQRAYGAGAALIAATTGMHVDEVKALIEAECVMYPLIEPYYEKLAAEVEASKRGVRAVVPHPDFPAKMVELRNGYHRTPDGKLYAWREQTSPKFVVEREGRYSGFSPTEIKNYEVQGTGGEFAKAACELAVRAFYAERNFDHMAMLINQVHDACYADSHKDVKLKAAALLHAAMELASDYVEHVFKWSLPVKVPSDTTSGPSMMDENKVTGIDSLVAEYKEQIKSRYFK